MATERSVLSDAQAIKRCTKTSYNEDGFGIAEDSVVSEKY